MLFDRRVIAHPNSTEEHPSMILTRDRQNKLLHWGLRFVKHDGGGGCMFAGGRIRRKEAREIGHALQNTRVEAHERNVQDLVKANDHFHRLIGEEDCATKPVSYYCCLVGALSTTESCSPDKIKVSK